jgi:sugar O-acyltransferase (sialic acid O-acetyltransferase NeuD family)
LNRKLIIVGYSGHAHTAVDILQLCGYEVIAYCDNTFKELNPFALEYWGSEMDEVVRNRMKGYSYFIGIGNNNRLRESIYKHLSPHLGDPVNAIHPTAAISSKVDLMAGHFIAANVSINACTRLGMTTVINTGSVIEHGCIIGDHVFVAPGAVLCGDVTIGHRTFVGANSVIKQGVNVGADVTIGAGTVVLKDVPDGATLVGNPGRIIR